MKGVINLADDPYGRRYYAAQKRRAFEKLKKTKEFLEWKRKQLDIQRGQCAYCNISLAYKNIVIHVDHIQPLYYEGKNDFSNLVLSCRRCNMRKWISNRYVKPSWIVKRVEDQGEHQRLTKARKKQKKVMRGVVNMELDEQLLSGFPLLFHE